MVRGNCSLGGEGVSTADERAAKGDIFCLCCYRAFSGLNADRQADRGSRVLPSFLLTYLYHFPWNGKFMAELGTSAAVCDERLDKLQGEDQEDPTQAYTEEEDQVSHRGSSPAFRDRCF